MGAGAARPVAAGRRAPAAWADSTTLRVPRRDCATRGPVADIRYP